MSWVALGTTALTVGGNIAMNAMGNDDGEGEDSSGGSIGGFNLQELLDFDFEEVPLLTETQDTLSEFGTGVLEGEIPEYYKMLGEVGGKEFEDLLGLTNQNIAQTVNEQLAKSGGSRAGAGAQIIAETTADADIKARLADLAYAKTGRTNLLSSGLSTLSNVSNTQTNLTNLINQFALNKAKLGVNAYGIAMGQAEEEGGFMEDIVGTIGSLIG